MNGRLCARKGERRRRGRPWDSMALLPCPWCGRVPRIQRYSIIKTGKVAYGVWCDNGNESQCPMIAVETNPFDTPQEAADAWNRRS